MTTTDPPAAEARIAGAPISWGVCEVPGWGYQLGPERVLAEMREVGLTATEFGPDGFLPAQPDAMTRVLDHHGLQAIGGFTPLLLHVADHDPAPAVERLLEGYAASGADVLVLSAVTGAEGYDSRPELDTDGWRVLLGNLDRLATLAAGRGVRAVLHPHVGTMVENGPEVRRVLEGSSISLCLDTGHLLIGGTDPAELARQTPERIAHVHFKDVDPLGSGDVDVPAIVGSLRGSSYRGWYVLEQDTILTEEPHDEGPVADVWTSAEHLRSVLRGAGPEP
jgi:inosose dehydratase